MELLSSPSPSETPSQLFSEYFRRYELLIEFTNLRNPGHCPAGIYVMPALDNINVWYGVIFVHRGYYKGGVFKFKIEIPPSYPADPPNIVFLTDMFHPLVANAQSADRGRFSLGTRYALSATSKAERSTPSDENGSDPNRNRIARVLHFLKRSFKKELLDRLETDDCLDKDAIGMYKNEHTIFAKLAEQCAQFSKNDSVLYENFPEDNPIEFSNLDERSFAELKSKVLQTGAASGSGNAFRGSSVEKVFNNIKSLGANGLSGLGKYLLE